MEALRKGETVQFTTTALDTQTDDGQFTSLAIPVKLRNQVLGVLNIRFKGKTIHPDIVTLIENATNRLALALENARLLQEIQGRAGREHVVGDITSKVRASTNVDDILKTAIKEIGEALGVSEVLIQLQNDDN